MSSSITARRLAAAAITAGFLAGAAALPASAADNRPHRPAVEITKVQYDSPGRDDHSNRSLNGEWVQITNNTGKSVNLDDWTLSDSHKRTYTFHHYRLGGHSSVKIHTGKGNNTYRDLYQGKRDYVWDDRDSATLRDDHRRVVDSESWGSRGHGGGNGGGHGHGH
ncbi:lamin tail domain-containing protein [Streptomyces sp. NPDC090306]|uniref:lamin tail domain-containing protein n=1 Tax=unclassified Streptomyces TaxID=2593676 RepID=UPI0036E929B9